MRAYGLVLESFWSVYALLSVSHSLPLFLYITLDLCTIEAIRGLVRKRQLEILAFDIRLCVCLFDRNTMLILSNSIIIRKIYTSRVQNSTPFLY